MIVKYQSYWTSARKLQSEAALIGRLDTSNKTKDKKKYEGGGITAEEIARKNHEDKLHYEFSVFNSEDDEFPYCYVTVVPRNKHIGVNFIDDAGRKYLSYHFHEINDERKLFLHEAWYFHFTSETQEGEDYRLHFVFDEEGNAAIRKYDEINKKTEDYESNRRFDMSGLYEKYPEFGQYESVVRLERDFPFDIIPPASDPKKPDSGPENKWLPPGWYN